MLGCDIIEIERIKLAYDRLGMRFARRILTPNEMEVFATHNRQMSFLAGRFAAKESISKTLQTGLAHGVTFHSIEVLPCEVSSSPRVVLHLLPRTEQLILGRLAELPTNTIANTIANTPTNMTTATTTNMNTSTTIAVDVSISHCRTYAMAVSRAVLLPHGTRHGGQ